jgi:glucosyl-dolichyl phosphate glucuronosyltransferase
MQISIVIATFNRAALLRITLEHLRGQAFEPGDEVIVVDNGSTDRTPEVVVQAAAGFPARFVSLRETVRGKTPALNRGVAAARGDVLALTDDDVLVAGDWLATIRRLFRDTAVDLVGGRVEPWWEVPPPRWLQVQENGRYTLLAAPLALLDYGDAQELGERTAVGANLVVRRSVLEALGGFAPHLGRVDGTLLCGEDHDFCERARIAGYRREYRPEVCVRHWVPASRLRLSYYVRWFFWAGATHAMLERGTPAAARLIPLYLVRRVLTTGPAAIGQLVAGRPGAAAAAFMSGVFAFGHLCQHLRDRLSGAGTAGERTTPGAALIAGRIPVNSAGVEQP